MNLPDPRRREHSRGLFGVPVENIRSPCSFLLRFSFSNKGVPSDRVHTLQRSECAVWQGASFALRSALDALFRQCPSKWSLASQLYQPTFECTGLPRCGCRRVRPPTPHLSKACLRAALGRKRMTLLKKFCASEFENVRDEFLFCLTRPDHLSTAKVVSCIAFKMG